MSNSKNIIFYYDSISPYAWLGWKYFQKIKNRKDVNIEVVPVLFAGLLNFHKNIGAAEIPAKRIAIFSDIIRKAELSHFKFKGPPSHPFNPLKSLRVCLAFSDPKRIQYTDLLLSGVWEDGEDATSEDFLGGLISKCGEDPGKILKFSNDPKVKNQLRENTENCAKNNIFGVPTFEIGSHLFWGADQIPLIESYLDGKLDLKLDEIDEFLSRPSSASRL